MKTIANILWHIPFLGFLNALLAFLVGSFFILTIIASPIGFGLIQYSKFLMTPFSSKMLDRSKLEKKQNTLWETYSFIISILYFPFGLFLTIITVFQIVLLFFSIFGIPLAIILFKSLGTYLNPVNKVSISESKLINRQKKP